MRSCGTEKVTLKIKQKKKKKKKKKKGRWMELPKISSNGHSFH
jgi:hypothetical protein